MTGDSMADAMKMDIATMYRYFDYDYIEKDFEIKEAERKKQEDANTPQR